jgi:hypothetical protein
LPSPGLSAGYRIGKGTLADASGSDGLAPKTAIGPASIELVKPAEAVERCVMRRGRLERGGQLLITGRA